MADAGGQIAYTDHDVTAGRSYEYAVGIMVDGREEIAGQVWVDIPRGSLALESVSPNPTSGKNLVVSFRLANSEPATLELVDVTGRRMAYQAVGSLGAGRHQVDLGRSRLDPGMYWIRLRQGGRMFSIKATVIR